MNEMFDLIYKHWMMIAGVVLAMAIVLLVITRRWKSLPYEKGDLTEQWRHTDDGHTYLSGPDSAKKGTVWKVLRITDDFVEMELVSGHYEWGFNGGHTNCPAIPRSSSRAKTTAQVILDAKETNKFLRSGVA
jgi:hypothetical protein